MTVTVLSGAQVLPDSRSAARAADLVIRDGRIAAIEPAGAVQATAADTLVDATRLLLAPGLVNGHLHSWDHYLKGCLENLTMEVAMALIRPRRPVQITPRQMYLRTMIGAIESLRTGATTLVDDLSLGQTFSREHVDAALQAYSDAGVRALVGFSMIDRAVVDSYPYLDECFPADLLAELRALPRPQADTLLDLVADLAGSHHPASSRVGVLVAPSAPHRCTDDFLRRCRRLADDLVLPVMTHCQETRMQIVTGHEFYGKSMVAHMAEIGFIKPDTTLIHGVWLSKRDIRLIADLGATVQYNPWSNAIIGAGIAPVRACLDAGINVSMGTDGVGLPFGVNMLNAMGVGAVLPNLSSPDMKQWLTAAEILRASTEGGATALGMGNEIGRIAVGMKADLVGYRLDSTTFTPLNDPVRQIVYAERGSNLNLVVVDGQIVMRDGRLTTIDETAILREAQAAHAELIDQLTSSQVDTAPFKHAIEAVYLKSLSCPIAHDHYAAMVTGNNIAAIGGVP